MPRIAKATQEVGAVQVTGSTYLRPGFPESGAGLLPNCPGACRSEQDTGVR